MEKKLYEWEAELHTKKLEINGLKEYVNQKQDKLKLESEGITKKISKLQSATKSYQEFVTKEESLKKVQEDIQK